jgi:hypothetical protein
LQQASRVVRALLPKLSLFEILIQYAFSLIVRIHNIIIKGLRWNRM